MVGARKLADLLAEPRATGLARQRRGLSASDASPATAQHVGHVSAAAGGWCTCWYGTRWWTKRGAPYGWCCGTCHPPDHLAGALGAAAGGDGAAAVGL
jgi:hypothetical protein